MSSIKRKFWRGGLALFFLLLSFAVGADPNEGLSFVLSLQETVQKNQDMVLRFLDFYREASRRPASEYPLHQTFLGTDNNTYKVEVDFAHIQRKENPGIEYDRIATIWRAGEQGGFLRIAEVDWDSKKTGHLPGPEASVIRLPNYRIESDDMILNGQRYYRTHMQFATTSPDKKPLLRGYVEILQNIQKQQIKISVSAIEGPSNILPAKMVQSNLQAIIGRAGYIYLRQEEGTPTRIPKNQRHFCRNAQGTFVSQNSQEWEESCAPLFDESIWHGFSYSLLPNSYDTFLKGPMED